MRRNIASQNVAFQMISVSTGLSITTGTPAVYYTIDGGTQGTGGGTATHEGNGEWNYVPVTAETNGNHVAYTMVLTNAITQTVNVYPVSFDPTDGVRIGLTSLPNAVAEAAGGLYTRGSGAGQINQSTNGQVDINLVRWLGAAAASPSVPGVPEVDVTFVAGTSQTGNDNGADINIIRSDINGIENVLGGLAQVAADGDPTSSDSVMQYIKQLVNILVGTAGVVTFPAESAPGNAVSLAEVIRAIYADVTGLNGAAMRGTDSAATATALTTAQNDLDILTGTDGVTLATSQPNYAPNTVVPDAAGVAPTAAEIRQEMDANSVDLNTIISTLGTAGAGLTDLGGMSTGMKAEVNTEADTALTDYDGPTNAQMETRTPTAAQLAYITSNSADGVPVTFTGGTTITAILGNVDGSAASSVDDFYNGAVLVFNAGTLKNQRTDITDYVGATKTATITAVTTAVTSSHTANLK